MIFTLPKKYYALLSLMRTWTFFDILITFYFPRYYIEITLKYASAIIQDSERMFLRDATMHHCTAEHTLQHLLPWLENPRCFWPWMRLDVDATLLCTQLPDFSSFSVSSSIGRGTNIYPKHIPQANIRNIHESWIHWSLQPLLQPAGQALFQSVFRCLLRRYSSML